MGGSILQLLGKTTAVLLVVFVIAGAIFVSAISKQLSKPDRRPLMDYHFEWLDDQPGHGMKIERFETPDGKTPCLFVTPAGEPAKRGTLLRKQLTERGENLEPYGEIRGLLVLLHGRKGRKEDVLPIAERFIAAGFACAIPDLPSHGESGFDEVTYGVGDAEKTLARTVLETAQSRFGLADVPAGLWGVSMGGAFATANSIGSSAPWEALIIVSSFDSFEGVLDDQLRIRLGLLGPMLKRPIESQLNRKVLQSHPAQWAQRVKIPVFVAHGTADELISLERGRQLFDSFQTTEKTWVEVEGGDHNGVLITAHPLFAEMSQFLRAHLKQD